MRGQPPRLLPGVKYTFTKCCCLTKRLMVAAEQSSIEAACWVVSSSSLLMAPPCVRNLGETNIPLGQIYFEYLPEENQMVQEKTF